MRRKRFAVWVFCSTRNCLQPAGPCQRNASASNGDTPWIAATARATTHSVSDHSGTAVVGLPSSCASTSVIFCKVRCSVLRERRLGRSSVHSVTPLPVARRSRSTALPMPIGALTPGVVFSVHRQLVAGIAVLPLARQQRLPASFQHVPAAPIFTGVCGCIHVLERNAVV